MDKSYKQKNLNNTDTDMLLEHFKLNTVDEVNLFSERLNNYQQSKIGSFLPHINLVTAYEKLQIQPHGGKLFTALLDLKLGFIMLNIDSLTAGAIWNAKFSKGKYEGGSVLDSQDIFNGKADVQYHYSNFVTRYRALWDKIMGVFILFFDFDNYEKYRRAKSRRKEFEKLSIRNPSISDEFIKHIVQGISDFDQKFRTPEVHGSGVIRKWSFTMLSIHETPLIDLISYWNWLLHTMNDLDKIIESLPPK